MKMKKVKSTWMQAMKKVSPLYLVKARKEIGIPEEGFENRESYDFWREKNTKELLKILDQEDESTLLARSIKFTEYTVTKLLSDVGFRTELLTTSEDRGYLLTMIQPTRYSV